MSTADVERIAGPPESVSHRTCRTEAGMAFPCRVEFRGRCEFIYAREDVYVYVDAPAWTGLGLYKWRCEEPEL